MVSMRYSLDAEIAALLHSPRGNWFCAYRALARNDSPSREPALTSGLSAFCIILLCQKFLSQLEAPDVAPTPS